MVLEERHDALAHFTPWIPTLGCWLPLGQVLACGGTCGPCAGLRGSSGLNTRTSARSTQFLVATHSLTSIEVVKSLSRIMPASAKSGLLLKFR